MPRIDVYAAAELFPVEADRQLCDVLRAEGVSPPASFQLENTAAFIHRMNPTAVQTAASGSARHGLRAEGI